MPRGSRKIYDGALLNITARGNNKKIIFRKDSDYTAFKKRLLRYTHQSKVKLYHYCLMRNHVHLIAKASGKESISEFMHKLQLSYFYCFKKRYGYCGRFWQGRFSSKLIEDESYLLTAAVYIEANPVRAKIEKKPEQYRWSSYNRYAWGAEDNLVELDPYYLELSNEDKKRQKKYRDIMRSYLGKDIHS